MTHRLVTTLGTAALLAWCLSSPACSRGGKETASSAAGGTTAVPGSPDCYRTTNAVACPRDPGDPSGKGLPTSGGVCTSPVCQPCGSASDPAFRDDTGTAKAGWCICVPRSDYVGVSIYTCRTAADWAQAFPQ